MRQFLENLRFNPVRDVEWVIIVFSALQAIYIFSPAYAQSIALNGLSPFAAALASQTLVYVFISGILITALMVAWGIYKNRPALRSAGMFGQFLFRLFNVLVTILSIGFLPITWIYAATTSAICVILWVAERIEVKRNGRT